MSSAYHPETDGQTERANRTIEDMLRAYVSPHQADWDLHLTAVEFAYNNSVQASTGYTPFYLNYGRHSHTPLTLFNPATSTNSVPLEERLAWLKQDIKWAKQAIAAAQQKQKQHADRTRRDALFNEGEEVLLSTENLNIRYTGGRTPKLAPRYIGPFTVLKRLTPVAYRLSLLRSWRCHNVFHISYLEEAGPWS
jgi:hypothetical protein